MVQQYRGSAVDIVYSPESLREIFVNNVRLVKADRMVQPERVRSNPLEAFLGRTSVTDTYTREEEDAFEYVCRHTLLRPRDLMTIGERLAALRPDERRNEYRLKEAVNQAATEIAHEYLAEIAPYVGDLELERLFHRLPGPRPDARRGRGDLPASDEARRRRATRFSALYRVGLLGYVQHDRVRGEWRQRFLRPGEATLETERRAAARDALPGPSGAVRRDRRASTRPSCSASTASTSSATTGRGASRRRVERERSTCASCCVLKADVQGFGSLMRAGTDGAGPQRARGSGEALGAAGGDHRDPRRRCRADRRRRSGGAGADGAPPDGRTSTRRPGSRACGSRCTTARCRRASATPTCARSSSAATRSSARPASSRWSSRGRSGRPRSSASSSSQRPSLWRTIAAAARPDGGDLFNVKKPGSAEPDRLDAPLPARVLIDRRPGPGRGRQLFSSSCAITPVAIATSR